MINSIYSIQGKILGQLSFSGQAQSCSKILSGEKIFNSAYIHLGVIRVIWASVLYCEIWTKVVNGYNEFDLDQALVFCENLTTGCR